MLGELFLFDVQWVLPRLHALESRLGAAMWFEKVLGMPSRTEPEEPHPVVTSLMIRFRDCARDGL
jgi:hypothetical protein